MSFKLQIVQEIERGQAYSYRSGKEAFKIEQLLSNG
jgi:hypothetical protein